METRKKKVEVSFVYDNDVHLIPYQEVCFAPPGTKLQGKAANSTPKRSGQTSQAADPELLLTLVEEPEVDAEQCSSDKPSALFENGDITGRQIFGFQTPKRRNAMVQKAIQSGANSPAEPKTPVHRKTPNKSSGMCTPRKNTAVTGCRTPKGQVINAPADLAKTPYNLRKRMKRKIVAAVKADDGSSSESEAQDFSGSESDWDKDDSDEDESPDEESKDELKPNQIFPRNNHIAPSQCRSTKLSYIPAPEEYFFSHASSKVRTSNHTLNRLRTPRLLQEQLQELLAKTHPSHQQALKKLDTQYHNLFPKWHFSLQEGFNILLHGVGSKRKLLKSFCSEISAPFVVVNGFFPSLTIQEVVDSITKGILGLSGCPMELYEAVDFIKSTFSTDSGIELYLMVHNIDGPMIRNDKSQEILASLASATNIHMVASVDHINAPLMWDQAMLSQFNFSWWDVTTFHPYSDETAFEGSLLVQRSGGLALSSLQNVFRSLTSNAKSIFLLMGEYQLNHKDKSNFSGMPFRDLYSSCREALLVSSDLALRSQLTEFLDHRLVRSRRGVDGSELLTIPINTDILSQFIEQQKEDL